MHFTGIVGNLLVRRNNAPQSSSSSSSDEEWNTVVQKYHREKRKLRPRIIDYDNVITRYSDEEFKSYFRSVCDRFNVGRATAVRAVRRVCNALFKKAPIFIQWPTGDRAIDVMHGFEQASRFPKTIGAIDGTHIHINAPKENPLVCDHKTLITHCYVGHPGSVHDQRVFRLSEVADYLNDDDAFPENSHLLGDSAYEIHQHLLTPYRDNGHLTESDARVTVERCIGFKNGAQFFKTLTSTHLLEMGRRELGVSISNDVINDVFAATTTIVVAMWNA
ncbi:hypothetical protein NQ318_002159 [Aromia moschata]|uniref:DDE Tnp4 domain-containing protein n=1 Tax=Aromia moschata TaxID=1265417 RepID=A0AAV8XGS2_9CUCU|nr:hypothetical protein NQ318_002159 [Aromia moschata]